MIDIEDRTEISDEIPYRLVSLGYGINSVQYHRAVFLCLKGNFYLAVIESVVLSDHIAGV